MGKVAGSTGSLQSGKKSLDGHVSTVLTGLREDDSIMQERESLASLHTSPPTSRPIPAMSPLLSSALLQNNMTGPHGQSPGAQVQKHSLGLDDLRGEPERSDEDNRTPQHCSEGSERGRVAEPDVFAHSRHRDRGLLGLFSCRLTRACVKLHYS